MLHVPLAQWHVESLLLVLFYAYHKTLLTGYEIKLKVFWIPNNKYHFLVLPLSALCGLGEECQCTKSQTKTHIICEMIKQK